MTRLVAIGNLAHLWPNWGDQIDIWSEGWRWGRESKFKAGHWMQLENATLVSRKSEYLTIIKECSCNIVIRMTMRRVLSRKQFFCVRVGSLYQSLILKVCGVYGYFKTRMNLSKLSCTLFKLKIYRNGKKMSWIAIFSL